MIWNKTKENKIIMNSDANGLKINISKNGSVLKHVNQFIILQAVVTDSGSESEILSTLETALSKLNQYGKQEDFYTFWIKSA